MSNAWETDRRTPSWRRVLGPAGLVVAGLVAGLVALPGTSQPSLPVAVEPTSAPRPEPEPVRERNREAEGRWRPMAGGPLSGRQHVVSAWTGSELLVWGGRVAQRGRWFADGAAYNPGTDRWRRLPPSPLRARASASGVWTGRELVIWGGAGAAGESQEQGGGAPGVETAQTTRAFADGAAYNPRTDQWRRLPRAPLSRRRDAAAVWTGAEVVVWGGRGISDAVHQPDGARYDPAADRWTAMAPGPLPRHDRVLVQAAALDGRMLVWAAGAATTRSAVYDPASDRWHRIAAPRLHPAVVPSVAAVAGGVMAWGAQSFGDRRPAAVRYTTSTGRWTDVAQPPFAPAPDQPLVAADAMALAWQPGGGVAYDGVHDRWHELPAGPDLPRDSLRTWAGDRLLLWSPGATPGGAGRAAIWLPDDPWHMLPEPPVPIDSGGTAVWAPTPQGPQQVLLWGGPDGRAEPVGAAFDPAVRLWEALPRPPLSRRVEPATAWSAPEMIVVGGRDLPDAAALRDAAAYAPSSRTWRRLPDAPMAVAGEALAAAGERLYAAGLQAGEVAVAMYVPRRDRWTSLPPPPIAAAVDRLQVAWTGRDLLVWGTRPDGEGAGAAWTPREQRWRTLPHLQGVRGRVAWTWATDRVFVLAEDGTTASLRPRATRWRRYARSPIRSASAVIAWNGHTLLGFDPWAPWTGRMATLDPRSSEWVAFASPPLLRHRDGRLLWTGQTLYAFAGRAAAALTP